MAIRQYPPHLLSESSDALDDLFRLAAELLSQLPRRSCVLLRPVVEPFDPEREDVDLLISEVARQQLLQQAFEAAERGRCHLRIVRHREDKVQLTLYSLNGNTALKFDLWTVFAQMALRPEYRIPAEQILNLAVPSDCRIRGDRLRDSVASLPPDVEFCIYVQHLESRKRSITSPQVQLRLMALKSRLIDQCDSEISYLFESLHQLLQTDRISRTILLQTHMHLLREVTDRSGLPRQHKPRASSSARAAAEIQRGVQRIVPCVAIDGSDGAGKTTLTRELAQLFPQTIDVVSGKKLYRRSWTYQILGGLICRLTRCSRESLDEFAVRPLVARAALAHWQLLARRYA
ncbi:MAG: hypothetical protein KDA85_19070, partial [Planctomycetaceae bacterium]|nr:hypothetical protein [Planctomycetaceae bacterium]